MPRNYVSLFGSGGDFLPSGGGGPFTVEFGERAGSDFGGTQDAYLLSGFPDTNFSSETTAAGPVLAKWALSNIAGPVTVTDAFITINVTSGGSGGFTINPRKVLRNWVEAQATWNVWSTGNNWTTAGCLSDGNDRSATNSCDIVYPGGFATGDIVSTNNTQLIADVENLINNPSNNFGWLVDVSGVSIALPANATASLRPILTVTYTT